MVTEKQQHCEFTMNGILAQHFLIIHTQHGHAQKIITLLNQHDTSVTADSLTQHNNLIISITRIQYLYN